MPISKVVPSPKAPAVAEAPELPTLLMLNVPSEKTVMPVNVLAPETIKVSAAVA